MWKVRAAAAGALVPGFTPCELAGMETFNGYDVSESNGPAAEDADVVAALRKAGAVVFGKSNVPAGTMDVQTFNDKFGVTVNPYDVENQTTAGGSSGGNSSALGAGMYVRC